ncbi:MAG: alanyl-tRNA editing protein [Gammaproteobacteria bacterium]|nr:alanyl-tRNA editing protein [Gammaproteobacteria bacterium]
MVKKLFWEDPYLCELETTVSSVVADCITLNETIFYAFSGGQESDAGTIGGFEVMEARKDGREIIYRMAEDHGLAPGQPVTVRIDRDRRYALMRHHFAAELILELVCQRLKTVEKIGAHIAENKARIDFYWPENISPLFPELLARASELIDEDLPITSAFSDEASQRRYWQVDGVARVPCGGTHLKRTGEVGQLGLKRRNIGKGKERIEIHATGRVDG